MGSNNRPIQTSILIKLFWIYPSIIINFQPGYDLAVLVVEEMPKTFFAPNHKKTWNFYLFLFFLDLGFSNGASTKLMVTITFI